jgi:hypothetical protein
MQSLEFLLKGVAAYFKAFMAAHIATRAIWVYWINGVTAFNSKERF